MNVLHCCLVEACREASVLMQRLSYPTETVLTNKITWNIIVQSFKDIRTATAVVAGVHSLTVSVMSHAKLVLHFSYGRRGVAT